MGDKDTLGFRRLKAMFEADTLEAECLEMMLHIDAMGLGLGQAALAIVNEAQVRHLRPLLLKQHKLQKAQVDMEDTIPGHDERIQALEELMIPVWEVCRERLRALLKNEAEAASEQRTEQVMP